MKRLLLTLALVFLLIFNFDLSTQAQEPTEAWVVNYNGLVGEEDAVTALVVDSSGNVYVTGYSSGRAPIEGVEGDYLTIKYDADGNQLWAQRYDGPVSKWDQPNDMAVDVLGNVYVTGMSTGLGYLDCLTIKYGPNGNQLWLARYNGTANDWDEAKDIAVDALGNVYIVGVTASSNGRSNYIIIKYNPDGNRLWIVEYDGPIQSSDQANALAVDEEGNVYVTGISYGGCSPIFCVNNDYATVKYDTNGNKIWEARYNGPANSWDEAADIAVDSAGNVYVTGTSDSETYADYTTVKYDVDGNEIWVARYNGPGNGEDSYPLMAMDAAGNVYVAGQSWGGATGLDYATVKYDTNGNQLWAQRYNGEANGDDFISAVVLTTDNYLYVTGKAYGADGSTDYATIKYDVDGNIIWMKIYDRPLDDGPDYWPSLDVGSDGNVYIAGVSYNEVDGSADYVTIKYTQAVDNTPSGTNVTVEAGAGTSIAFGNVTTEGNTTSTESGSNVQLTDYVTTIMAREITTTAAWTGSITITLYYGDLVAPGLESFIEMLKLNPSTNLWEAPANGTVIDSLNKTASGTFSYLCVLALAIEPLEAKVKVEPESINPKSNGVFTVFMDLPADVKTEQLDLATFVANETPPQEVRFEGKSKINAKFQRQGFPFGAGEITAKVERGIDGQTQIIRGKDSVDIKDKSAKLLQNFPNPPNPETWIPFQLDEDTDVMIVINNAAGQLIRTLNLGFRIAGLHATKEEAAYWDGKNDAGEKVSSGIYFYTIKAGEFTATEKMVIQK